MRRAFQGQAWVLAAALFGVVSAASTAAMAQGGIQRAPVPAGPERVTLTPAVFPVGKWPEGIAYDGAGLWVAESGQRKIARIDPNGGRRMTEANIGRLPVDMIGDPGARSIQVLVNTDKKLMSWQEGVGTKTLATLRDCPQALAAGTDEHVGFTYVLAHQNCSSGEPRVIAVDARGNARGSGVLETGGYDIAFANGAAWVVHMNGIVTAVDADSLAPITVLHDVPAFGWKIEAGAGAVFVAGKTEQMTGAPTVVRIDPSSYATTDTQVLPGGELIGALAVSDGLVVAIGSEGTIWVFDAADLRLRRVITSATGPFEPRAAVAVGDTLYVTTFAGQGENGSIYAFAGWRP